MQDEYGRSWIIEKGVPIVQSYAGTTIREVHYDLVVLGMPNTIKHYGRVKAAMTAARWAGLLDFDDFEDYERELVGTTEYDEKDVDDEIERSKNAIASYIKSYYLNRWSNQDDYVEVWIEKKALRGKFEPPCDEYDVALFPCKGYPSLTWLNRAIDRFRIARSFGKNIVVLYFGDYDPSGEDIPRSIGDNFRRMGMDIDIERIALMEHQVIDMGLPPAPTKLTDSRSVNWTGIGQVEIEAVPRDKLRTMVVDAIERHFDRDKYAELNETEGDERTKYRTELKEWIINFNPDEE